MRKPLYSVQAQVRDRVMTLNNSVVVQLATATHVTIETKTGTLRFEWARAISYLDGLIKQREQRA